MPVLRVFELVESSTRGDRVEFMAMIAFVKKQRKRIAIVADAVDRVQRSFKESILLDDLRKTGLVEVHFLREGLVLNEKTPPEMLLMWDFSTLTAKSYVTALSHNVRRSMQFKLQNGEWIRRAPVGYLNRRDAVTGKSTVVVDPSRSPLIKEAFRLYATRAYSIASIAKRLQQMGLTNSLPPYNFLAVNTTYKMLKNPFYMGQMLVGGKRYPHKYPPLISAELFEECQDSRDRFKKKPFKYKAKPFVFRGLISCVHCGCAITSVTKKQRYTYLHCTKRRGKCPAIYVREEIIIAQVVKLM